MKSKALLGLTVLATFFALTGAASAQTGFAWACRPTTASYDATVTCFPFAYNSRGGAVTIRRSGIGVYAVNFHGLGGRTIAGGNVQVTAYLGQNPSVPNVICNSISWGSGGTDFVANVRCVRAIGTSGTPIDSAFNILVGWFGQ